MKKKIIISIFSTLVAILLIVAITMIAVVFSKNLDNNIDFLGKEYNSSCEKEIVLNVASYNVRGGYSTKEKLESINAKLNELNVDIAGIQEVDSDSMLRSRKVKCISTLTGKTYINKFFQPTNSLFLGKNYGIMNISKHKLSESNGMFLPMPNRWFMLIGEPRVVVRSIVKIGGVDIAFYNTHLSFENNIKMKNGKEMRSQQMEFIFNLMESDPCQHKILVGDMNVLNFGEYEIFVQSGKYNLVNNSNTNYVSYRGDDCEFRCLDNIIYSDNLHLTSSKMIDNDLSDHNMLFASFVIE